MRYFPQRVRGSLEDVGDHYHQAQSKQDKEGGDTISYRQTIPVYCVGHETYRTIGQKHHLIVDDS